MVEGFGFRMPSSPSGPCFHGVDGDFNVGCMMSYKGGRQLSILSRMLFEFIVASRTRWPGQMCSGYCPGPLLGT